MGIRDRLRLERWHAAPAPSVPPSLSPSPAALHRSQFGSLSSVSSRRTFGGVGSVDEADDGSTGLGRFVNIAFCGGKGVGKSKLINSICQKHIANEKGREHHVDGNRYIHPSMNDVALYEMPVEYSARKDFRGFTLVIVVFNGSVRKLDMETAFRAHERDVPVLFVHTRADQMAERLFRLGTTSDTSVLRDIVNKNADKGWYQQRDHHKKIYLVSCLALEKRERCQFDEIELLRRIEPFLDRRPSSDYQFSGLASVQMDNAVSPSSEYHASSSFSTAIARRSPLAIPKSSEGSTSLPQHLGGRMSQSANSPAFFHERDEEASVRSSSASHNGNGSKAADFGFGASKPSGSTLRAPLFRSSPRTDPKFMGARCDQTPQCKGVPHRTSPNNDNCSSNSAPLSPPPAAIKLAPAISFSKNASPISSYSASVNGASRTQAKTIKIAFLENVDPNSTTPTLMESFLGFIAGTDRTIVQNNPYKHPEYPGNVFFSISTANAGKNAQSFIENHRLPQLRLAVLVIEKALKEWDFILIKELRRYGVDIICCHVKPDDHSHERAFSPRRTYRKLKELAHTTAQKSLQKNGLSSIPFFTVNPRILRMPDSFPKSDEEDFKEYIATVCGGRTPPSHPANYLNSSPSDVSRSTHAGTVYSSPVALPEKFASTNSFGSKVGQKTPKSALINGSRSTPVSPKTASNSVTFLCRQQVLVGVVGQEGCGKSTLIRKAVGLKTANDESPPASARGPKSIRHPAFYDLIFQDYPGYDALDQSVGSDRWIHQNKLQDMDWIILVFQVTLTPADVSIAHYAELAQIPVVFVATKCDLCIDAFIYDKNMVEKAAIEHTRFSIVQAYRIAMEQCGLASMPLFLVSGRTIERKSKHSKNALDEEKFLNFIQTEIAGSLR